MSTRQTIEVPAVHLNGSSVDDLFEQHLAVVHALRGVEEAMRHAAPNARDYYVKGDASFGVARDQHVDRLRRLRELRDEHEAILHALADARDARKARAR